MLVVVEQALGDVERGDVVVLGLFGKGEDEFVAGAALGVGGLAADGFEALEQVVGGEGGVFADADHAFAAEHHSVEVGAQEDAGVAHEGAEVADAGGQSVGVDPVVVTTLFVQARHGGGQVVQQALGDAHRAGAGAAAAVGGGEGFVQVHVDDVEAHVAGAHLAEDGVEVGAVVVEQAAGVVDGFGDGFDLPLEDAAGGRVGHHQAGGLRAAGFFEGFQVHVAVFADGHFADFVAAHDGGGRVGAVGGFGDQDFGAGVVAAGFVVGADHGDAGEFTLGAGHGGERDAFHAGDFLEEVLQLVQAGQVALAVAGRGERVPVEEAGQHGRAVGAARVVFHGAGAERVELLVDGEVLGRQVGVVAHHFQLAHFRQAGFVFTAQAGGNRGQLVLTHGLGRLRGGAAAGAGVLEDQRGFVAHARTSLTACANRSRSPSVWTSVLLTKIAFFIE